MIEKQRSLPKCCYRYFFWGLDRYLRHELKNCNMVVDLGCGQLSPIRYCNTGFVLIGSDIYWPYIEESKSMGIHKDYFVSDLKHVGLKENSIDAALLLDVLEHLPKEDGKKLLEKAETWTRKKIIVFTPNGYLWQDDIDDNPFQTHRSSWTVKEFEDLGYKVIGIGGLKYLRGYKGRPKLKPRLAWLFFSDLTQKIVTFTPNLAFQLLCVKDL